MPKNSPKSGIATFVGSEPTATGVDFAQDFLVVTLRDGRVLSVPLEWFPRLRVASEGDRRNWRLIANGYGIHWPALDEDISVPGLLGLPD
jgi:hypothetical protein